MITRAKKQEIIKDLTDRLSRQKAVVFSDYTGLSVNKLRKLRQDLRKEGIEYRVIRKTLIDLALEKSGFKEIKVKGMPGQIGAAFGYSDEAAPAKILYNFSQKNKELKLVAGLINGQYLTTETVIALAQLPSKDVLIAKAVDAIKAPLAGLVYSLKGNLTKFVYIIKNIKK